ncbi:MAG: ATP-binding protein [Lachnospiraceae bacterium]|nr:ATP-binding protein [Lachnospiraceae bacterium]
MFKPKHYLNIRFIAFSCLMLFIVYSISIIVYIFAVRQINLTYVRQQLVVSGETIKLNVAQVIASELSLVTNMASSPIIQRYMLDPYDPELREFAHAEFEMFETHMKTGIAFWISDIEKYFYFTDITPYFVDADAPENYWYNLTLYETQDYNFNINYNAELDMINLWVNAPVFAEIDGRKTPIGMLGTAINLSEIVEIIEHAHRERSRYITAYFFNQFLEITHAADIDLIHDKVNIIDHLGDAGQIAVDTAASIVDGAGINYIYGDHMYRVGIIPAIKDWNIVMSYPMPGLLALNQEINYVFFGMLALIAVLFIFMNIIVSRSESATRRQNIRLSEANKKAEKASKAKSNFLATMSHEIRTPLNAIIGIAQVKLQEEDIPEEYAEAFEKTYSSGNNLLGIINDILDMSKIETGKMELSLAEYDVPSLIQDSVQVNLFRIGQKPIEIIVEANENLPSKLIGDELRLKQILSNVLSNAFKYTKEGYVKLSVNYKFEQGLSFVIEDTGQGIKPEDKKKLFMEYARFNTDHNHYIEGTGLGLNITKSIVELMGGKISAESEYGKGTTFTIKVKQQTVECPPIGSKTAEKLSTLSYISEKKDFKNMVRHKMPYGKVLVVDDVDTNLYVAEAILLSYKLKIKTAKSGFEALDIVKEIDDFDIIFMDHMMPDMDGIETTRHLRERGYKGVIVALTANALVGSADMFLNNGFNDFISKPINIKAMNVILNKYVRAKYPEEAKEAEKAEKGKASKNENADEKAIADPLLIEKLNKIFREDAIKARKTLQDSFKDENFPLFTTTVHAMKSALANIGKTEASNLASELEEAGRNLETQFINENLVKLIKELDGLINEFAPEAELDDELIVEDKAYLKAELIIIKNALDDYDDKLVIDSINRLNEKRWKSPTASKLKEIHDAVYFDSDFEKAALIIDELEQ